MILRLLFGLSMGAGVAVLAWWHTSRHMSEQQLEFTPPTPSLLEDVRQRGYIRVVSENSPTTFYVGSHGAQGFEYELVSAFADYLQVAVHLDVADSVEDVINIVAEGEADIGAAGIPRLSSRERRVMFSPSYLQSVQQVVCRRFRDVPDDVADLVNFSVIVPESGWGNKRLLQLQQLYPSLSWHVSEDSVEQIFEKIIREAVDCTIADSNIVRINQRYFPELEIAFDISNKRSLAWALPPDSYEFQRVVNDWFSIIEANGELKEIVARNFDHVKSFDYVDIRVFHRRIEKLLPKLMPFFEQAASDYKIPWTVLAAQAYQESHWNPRAKSPTGVRGLMMLTRTTARELGISNRLDAEESVRGGAKYLSKLLMRVPPVVKGRDRLWFALAAYNVGMGHVHDAQGLARALGYSEDTWVGLKQALPLLSQPKYYKQLKHGYARGHEPVRYVEQIKGFIDILDKYFSRSDEPEITTSIPRAVPPLNIPNY